MSPAFWVREFPALESLFKVFAEDQKEIVLDFVRGDETRNCQEEAKCLFHKMVVFLVVEARTPKTLASSSAPDECREL